MNSFFIPALAGQIYAMPGMETTLHAVINRPGEYEGFSANYSGAGFSDMRFKFHGLAAADFDRWVQSAKADGSELSRDGYLQLEKPSEREPVRRYRQRRAGPVRRHRQPLRRRPARCACGRSMAIDARGGRRHRGALNVAALRMRRRPGAPGNGATRDRRCRQCHLHRGRSRRQSRTAVRPSQPRTDATMLDHLRPAPSSSSAASPGRRSRSTSRSCSPPSPPSCWAAWPCSAR